MKSCNNGTRIKIGILGCSDIAQRKFIPAVLSSDKALLSGIAGQSRHKSSVFVPGAEYAAMEPDELISSPGIDLVYISLPNHLHEEWTVRALEAGRHVICEKPLGLDRSSVDRMIDCADRHRLLLFENLMFLYHPQHAAVKRIVDSGEVGKIVEFRAAFGIPELNPDNFRVHPEMGGGAFHDMARYPIAAALNFLGFEEYRFTGIEFEKEGLTISVTGTAATGKGKLFSYSMGFGRHYECLYELIGSCGRVRLDRAFTTPPDMENVIRIKRGDFETSLPVPPADHFRLALDHACRLVRDGGPFDEVHTRSRNIALLAEKMKQGCILVW